MRRSILRANNLTYINRAIQNHNNNYKICVKFAFLCVSELQQGSPIVLGSIKSIIIQHYIAEVTWAVGAISITICEISHSRKKGSTQPYPVTQRETIITNYSGMLPETHNNWRKLDSTSVRPVAVSSFPYENHTYIKHVYHSSKYEQMGF